MVPDVSSFRPEADVAVLDSVIDEDDTRYAGSFYLVAEILSDSNTDKDIATKSRRYVQHPQNLYFLLIEQTLVRVEVCAPGVGMGAGRAGTARRGVGAAGMELPRSLAALYRGTQLEAVSQT
jgi:hypothetical protein